MNIKLGFWERVFIVGLQNGFSITAIYKWMQRNNIPECHRKFLVDRSGGTGVKLSLKEMEL